MPEITKKEFSALDAHPTILYAKRASDSDRAYPVLATSSGSLSISVWLTVPTHDQQVIDETDPNNIIITYKLLGATVGTKTIGISGAVTTITVA